MTCPFVIKICSKCKKLLVANSNNFQKNKNSKDGLRPECKACSKKVNKKSYEKKINEPNYQENKSNYNKNYYEKHKEKKLEYSKVYREEHKEYYKEYSKDYYQNNKEKCFNKNIKRRLNEQQQGRGINKEQWLEMMNYFNWQCAYSGLILNDMYRTIDHIVSIKRQGAHEVWNCVPMYRNYNLSKRASNPLEWYQQQDYYSEERLQKIIEWQLYAYDKWALEGDNLILITELDIE